MPSTTWWNLFRRFRRLMKDRRRRRRSGWDRR